jgi:hypothetical protein
MTDTVTSKNTDLSSWALYILSVNIILCYYTYILSVLVFLFGGVLVSLLVEPKTQNIHSH